MRGTKCNLTLFRGYDGRGQNQMAECDGSLSRSGCRLAVAVYIINSGESARPCPTHALLPPNNLWPNADVSGDSRGRCPPGNRVLALPSQPS